MRRKHPRATTTAEPAVARIDSEPPINAGDFGQWLHATRSGNTDADVPCGTCTGCCRSAYFIHIEPDEHAALAAIPHELQFPAPGLPAGHMLLGYNDRGHCPMLVDNRCTIYAVRPRTCRRYDCRVFAAAGLTPVEPDKAPVAERTPRWQFSYTGEVDRAAHAAVVAAAAFLRSHAERFAPGVLPANSTQLAMLAVHLQALFMPGGVAAQLRAEPTTELLASITRAIEAARAG